MPEVAVELRNVTKRFSGPGGEKVIAVRNMQLEIPDGEFFSFLGPSGCGKTTSLRLIGGFEVPSEGEIYIGGEWQGYTPPYKRPVNTVFQNYALFPHMSVAENVAFGLEMQKVEKSDIKRRVAEALEMVQMSGMGPRKPTQLSGGQQQRVALARALINHPKVLLLDEPLGALDLKLRKAMQIELKHLQERVGITFVYVTHDQEEALTMSDRIGVMDHGVLLQVGTAQEIYEAPASRFVSDFIGETNYLTGQVSAVHDDDFVDVMVAPDACVRANGQGMREGQHVTVAFRPEKIRLNPDSLSEQAHNFLSGTVADVIYTGSATTYAITTVGDAKVVVSVQNVESTTFGRIAHLDDQVTIAWPIQSCKAFPKDDKGGAT